MLRRAFVCIKHLNLICSNLIFMMQWSGHSDGNCPSGSSECVTVCRRRCLHVAAVRLRGTGITIVISDSVRGHCLHETVKKPTDINYKSAVPSAETVEGAAVWPKDRRAGAHYLRMWCGFAQDDLGAVSGKCSPCP